MPGDRAKRLREVGSEARDQATGTVSNARGVLRAFAFDKILPPSLVDAISNGLDVLSRAAGRDSPAWGIFSSVTLILIGLLTSWTGLGIGLLVVGGVVLVYNLLRLVPAVNDAHRWVGKRVGLYEDRDIPWWQRD